MRKTVQYFEKGEKSLIANVEKNASYEIKCEKVLNLFEIENIILFGTWVIEYYFMQIEYDGDFF